MLTTMRALLALLAFAVAAEAACSNPAVTAYFNTGGSQNIAQGSSYGTGVCFYSVTTTNANKVQRVHLNSYDLEKQNDQLRFYDGSSAAAPLLGQVRLQGDDSYLATTGPVLFIELITDEFAHGSGFDFDVVEVDPIVTCAPGVVRLIGGADVPSTSFGAVPYGANITCRWIVPFASGVLGMRLNVDADGGDIAPGDAIYIYDGPTEASPLRAIVGTLGRESIPLNFNNSLIKFVSQPGPKLDHTGFKLCLDAAPTGQQLQCSGRQVFNVTAYQVQYGEPGPYGWFPYQMNVTCEWELWAPPGQSVAFQFYNERLQHQWANLYVYDSVAPNAKLLLATNQPGGYVDTLYVSAERNMLVRFVSLPAPRNDDGFSFYAQYVSQPVVCAPGSMRVILSNQDPVGFPVDPFYPMVTYPPGLTCSLLLQPSSENGILIQFYDIRLRPGDTLTIATLNAANVTTSVRTLASGGINNNTANRNINFYGNPPRVLLTFTSAAGGSVTEGVGAGINFDLDFFTRGTECSGSMGTLTNSGTLAMVSNNNMLYSGPRSCTWLLDPSGGKVAQLVFPYGFDFAPGDWLAIFNGNDASAPLLTNYTGEWQYPSTLTSSPANTNMFVWFYSGIARNTSHLGFTGNPTFSSVNNQADQSCAASTGPTTIANPNDPLVRIQSSSNSDLTKHRTLITCMWTFTRGSGYEEIGFNFRLNGDSYRIAFNPGDSLNVYDGPDTSSPVAWTSDDQSYSVYTTYTTTNQVMTVVYKAGSLQGGGFNLDVTAAKLWNTNGNEQGYYPSGICSGMRVINLASRTEGNIYKNEIYGAFFDTQVLQSNMRCSWILNATKLSPDSWVEIVPYGGADGDVSHIPPYTPGAYSWAVYDGPTHASPIVLQQPSILGVQLQAGKGILIEFNTSSLPQKGWGLRMYFSYHDKSVPCSGHVELLMPEPIDIASATEWSGYINFPTARVCSWHIIGPPGSVVTMIGGTNRLEGNEVVNVYDGVSSDNDTILFSLGRIHDSYGAIDGVYKTSTSEMYIIYDTRGPSSGGGFTITIDVVFPPKPCQGIQRPYINFPYCTDLGTGQIANRPNAQYTPTRPAFAQLFPELPGTDCTYEFVIPPTTNVNFKSQNLYLGTGGYLEVLQNGLPLFYQVDNCGFDIQYMYGVITMHFHTGPGASPYLTEYFGSNAAYYDDIWAADDIALDDVICNIDGVTFNTPDDAAPYENCTLMDSIQISADSGVFSFPNVRYVKDVYVGERGPTLDAPELLGATHTFEINGDALLGNLTNLWFNPDFVIGSSTNTILKDLVFPNMNYSRYFGSQATSNLETLSLPRLVTGWDGIGFDNAIFLRSVHLPLLESITTISLLNTPALEDFFVPRLHSFQNIQILAGDLTSFSLDSVNADSIRGDITLSNMPLLLELSLPYCTGLDTLNVDRAPQLVTINLPQLQYVSDEMSLSGPHIDALDLPMLQMANDFELIRAAYAKAINMPQALYLSSLTVTDTVITTIDLPSLQRLGDSFFSANYLLSAINLCAMTQSGNVTVSQCPALSCQETHRLFENAGAQSVIAASPDCNPTLLGSFGCVVNVTTPVDTLGCGFGLGCIQAAIDAAYQNKQGVVFVPAGTYTGCATPLTLRGKVITVRGSAGGGSVIDCAGSGRAFVFNSGEGRGSEISDLTLLNGAAATGGLIQITNVSPTLRRISLRNAQATSGNGGALAITGASAFPLLVNVNFTANLAASGSGGALSVSSGARLSIQGGVLTGNQAGVQAGAALFSGAGAIDISGAVFSFNVAAQGGAIFTDGPLSMSTCTLLSNRAAQFAGAVASIPANAADHVWLNVTDSVLRGNHAETGGAIYEISANLYLAGTTVRDNVATTSGGGVAALCSPIYKILTGLKGTCPVYLLFAGVSVVNNTAGANGGGISVTDCRLYTSGGTWSLNSAALLGGAIHTSGSLLEASGEMINANSALRSGGGVYCEPFTGSCNVRASSLSTNYAGVSGGGVFLCTAACPNVSRDASATDDGPPPAITTTSFGNSFTGNGVAAGAYGADVATDPARLVWDNAPDSTVITGRGVSSQALSVQVVDSFAAVVTTADLGLIVYLDVTLNGAVTSAVVISGADTSLAIRGVATFTGVTLTASDASFTNTTYGLRARTSAAVTATESVVLAPCAPGMGRTQVSGPMVCVDCLPGYFGNVNTDYSCTACAKGSYADATSAGVCKLCPVDTFASATAATVCQACAAGSSAPQPGSSECIPGKSDAITDGGSAPATSLLYPLVGAGAGVLLLIILGGFCLWRLARRKTMQKYYLDSDSTIRASGYEETPLMKAVKKIIGASSTTRAGGGQYADVYKAKHETRWIALKVIKKEMANSVEAQSEFRREAVALSRVAEMKHGGIVELVFFLERNPMCVAMEFCASGTLKRLLEAQSLSILDKVRLATETASAMVTVHACSVVHLDLKTDNLLLTEDMHVKLADFGISRILDGSGEAAQEQYLAAAASMSHISQNPIFASSVSPTQSMYPSMAVGQGMSPMSMSPINNGSPMNSLRSDGSSGGDLGSGVGVVPGPPPTNALSAFTPQYVDPLRILEGTVQDAEFLRSTDVFSFGVVMWAIFSQQEPYAGVPVAELIKDLKANPATKRPADIGGIHPAYDAVMKACWHADPAQRPRFAVVFDRLRACLEQELQTPLTPEYEPRVPADVLSSRRASFGASSLGGGNASGTDTLRDLESLPPPPPPQR